MNLLYCTRVDDETSVGVLNRLIEHYSVENNYIISWDKSYEKKTNGHVEQVYKIEDIIDLKYDEYPKYSESPIDAGLLQSMSPHETQIFEMLKRYGNVTSVEFDDMVVAYHAHLRYWNSMLDATNVNMVVFTISPHLAYDYIIYCLCKIKNIPVAITYPAPIEGYSLFFDDIYDPSPDTSKYFSQFMDECGNTKIDDIVIDDKIINERFDFLSNPNNDKTPRYMKVDRTKRFVEIFSNVKKRYRNNGKLYIWRNLKKLFFKTKQRYYTKRLFRKYDSISIEPDYSKRYIYFPLHLQPENTTLPFGGEYVYQNLAIEMLSSILPSDVIIYVKENPKQQGIFRDRGFYDELAKYDNVEFVHRKTNTYDLLENCMAVSTITGTAGFEGQFYQKPFIMFGYNIYMYTPGTYMVRNMCDCERAIHDILQNGPKHSTKELKIFFKAMSYSLPYCLIDADERGIELNISSEENINTIAKGFITVLDKQLLGKVECVNNQGKCHP